MNLDEKLRKLSEEVKRKSEAAHGNEANTREYLIKPFLAALGYDTAEPNDVAAEFTADFVKHSERVDYALKKDGKPIILIEFKAASVVLSRKDTLQLQRYINSKLDVRFGMLTNGIEYQVYTDLDKTNVMDDQPFLVVDLLHLNNDHCKRLELFTKSGFDVESCLEAARKLKYERSIRQALKDELEPLSTDLLRHFVKKISPGALPPSKSLLRIELEELVRRSWDEYIIEKSGKTQIDPPIEPRDPEPQGKDIPVFGYYDGHRFEAVLLRKSINKGLTIGGAQIRYNGQTTWLKKAAVMAIRSVDPSFEPTRTFPNGFQFWHVIDPEGGKEHMIRFISGWDMTDEALRQRVLAQ